MLTGAYAVRPHLRRPLQPRRHDRLWPPARRFAWKDVGGYVVAQLIGATVAASVLYVIASGQDDFDAHATGFASNGYGDHSPGGYSLLAALITEIVLTAFFLYVILGALGEARRGRLRPVCRSAWR